MGRKWRRAGGDELLRAVNENPRRLLSREAAPRLSALRGHNSISGHRPGGGRGRGAVRRRMDPPSRPVPEPCAPRAASPHHRSGKRRGGQCDPPHRGGAARRPSRDGAPRREPALLRAPLLFEERWSRRWPRPRPCITCLIVIGLASRLAISPTFLPWRWMLTVVGTASLLGILGSCSPSPRGGRCTMKPRALGAATASGAPRGPPGTGRGAILGATLPSSRAATAPPVGRRGRRARPSRCRRRPPSAPARASSGQGEHAPQDLHSTEGKLRKTRGTIRSSTCAEAPEWTAVLCAATRPLDAAPGRAGQPSGCATCQARQPAQLGFLLGSNRSRALHPQRLPHPHRAPGSRAPARHPPREGPHFRQPDAPRSHAHRRRRRRNRRRRRARVDRLRQRAGGRELDPGRAQEL